MPATESAGMAFYLSSHKERNAYDALSNSVAPHSRRPNLVASLAHLLPLSQIPRRSPPDVGSGAQSPEHVAN